VALQAQNPTLRQVFFCASWQLAKIVGSFNVPMQILQRVALYPWSIRKVSNAAASSVHDAGGSITGAAVGDNWDALCMALVGGPEVVKDGLAVGTDGAGHWMVWHQNPRRQCEYCKYSVLHL